MNIIANNVASKLFVAFVAAAMLFTLATPAKAATAEELQAQIAALMAQISALQGSTSGSSSAACTFTRPLTVGSQGADVKCLQDAMTPTYFNNAGGSTGYFGPMTAAAVAKWQTANGISPAVGYFGPVSQAKFNSMNMSDDSTDDSDDSTDDSDDSTDDSNDSNSGDLQGEADLTAMEVADGEDSDDVEEGAEDVQVGEFTYEFSDGDAEISRIDLALYVDGGNNGDDEVTVVVAVSVNNSVDGVASSDTEDWNIAAGPVRFVDADDVTSTETVGDAQAMDGSYTGTVAEFSIEEAGAGDDLNLEDSDEDPKATTFELDEDKNVEHAIFAFELDADDSDGDIELNDITLTATATGVTDMDDLVNDFRLEVDGQSFKAESYVGTGLVATLVFDIDGDVTVTAEDMVTAMLYADFEDMETADQGATIVAGVTAGGVDAEGVEDVTVDGSSVESNVHTLRTGGVAVEYVSDTVAADENNDTLTTDNAADYTLKFNVAAFGSDSVYLPFGANASTTILTDGIGYSIIDTNSNAIVSHGLGVGTSTPGLTTSGGSTVTKVNSFKVGSSDVAFTLTVNFDPNASGSYKLRLDSIMFAASDVSTGTSIQDVSDLDIETDPITISN